MKNKKYLQIKKYIQSLHDYFISSQLDKIMYLADNTFLDFLEDPHTLSKKDLIIRLELIAEELHNLHDELLTIHNYLKKQIE